MLGIAFGLCIVLFFVGIFIAYFGRNGDGD